MRQLYLLVISSIVCLSYSCSGMLDNIDPFLNEGDIIYVGKLDSLKAYPGINKVKIQGTMLYGVNQTQCVISWKNPGTLADESKEFPVARTKAGESFDFILEDLEEGQYDFSIITLDQGGNESIPNTISTYVYGEQYKQGLASRILRSIESSQISNEAEEYIWVAQLTWAISRGDGIVGCNIEYELANGEIKKRWIPVDELEVNLTDYKENGSLRYTTLILPEEQALDTFRIESEEFRLPEKSYVGVSKDLTNIYLKNAGSPFERADDSADAWGIIKDWSFTPNIVNQSGGQAGGFHTANGGCVRFETENRTGPGYANGKMWQTITLPKGKYLVKAYLNRETTGINYTANLVVAAGNELPDNDSLDSSIAYTPIRHTEGFGDKSVNFELDDATTLSLGWVVSLNAPTQTVSFNYINLSSVAE